MTDELNEREIAMIMTIVKLVEINRETKAQPSGKDVRYWYTVYLQMNREFLKPPAPGA